MKHGEKIIKMHFIVHELFEDPGALKDWAISRGYEFSFSRVYLNEELPEDVGELDLLIVLGGPQSPNTTQIECPHFDSNAEINLIRRFIKKEKAVLGVCLGAQLIGEALGATFEASPEKEIGAFPIFLTEAGKSSKKLSHFPSTVVVGHWHGDMPGLTDKAKILSFSEGCPRQIVEYSDLVYGFQCHLEFSPESIELLITHSGEELDSLKNGRFIQQPDELQKNDFKQMNELLFVFLDKLVEHYNHQQTT